MTIIGATYIIALFLSDNLVWNKLNFNFIFWPFSFFRNFSSKASIKMINDPMVYADGHNIGGDGFDTQWGGYFLL